MLTVLNLKLPAPYRPVRVPAISDFLAAPANWERSVEFSRAESSTGGVECKLYAYNRRSAGVIVRRSNASDGAAFFDCLSAMFLENVDILPDWPREDVHYWLAMCGYPVPA
jgi:hypothetical protein